MPNLDDIKAAAALFITPEQKTDIFKRYNEMDQKFWQRVRTDLPEHITHQEIVSTEISAHITLAAVQVGRHGHCINCVLEYVQTFGNACIAEFQKRGDHSNDNSDQR